MVDLSPRRDPAQPFVTFYNESTAERTELSQTSLRNWQSKTANYLRDGLGIHPGDRLALLLPVHWVTTVWLAAARSLGVTVTLDPSGDVICDVAVIGPDAVADPPVANEVIACSLRPLAQPFDSDLPLGIEDYFAQVRNYGDTFSSPPIDRAAPLLTLDGRDLDSSQVDLEVARLAEELGLAQGARLLLTPATLFPPGGLTAREALALHDLPSALRGSVVIAVGTTEERIAMIAEQEHVTTHLHV